MTATTAQTRPRWAQLRQPQLRPMQLRPMQSRQPRLRLTRRGRVVLTLLITAIVFAVAAMFAAAGDSATATSQVAAEPFEYVTVQPGQSLWQVARTVAPDADPRHVVSEIARLNQLQTSVLHPGDRIAIPRAYAGTDPGARE